MYKCLLSLFLILTTESTIYAQDFSGQVVDLDTLAISNSTYQFQVKQIIIPSAFIIYGATGFLTDNKNWLDKEIHNKVVNKWNTPFTSYRFDDYMLALPALSVYGLNMVGIKGKHSFVDRSVILGTSTIISLGFIQTLKPLTHNLRPDETTYDSWPSGHTTLAFAGAEFMRIEYKDKSPWYGVFAYGVASTVGIMRIYNNRHWLTDVVAGAGFGILSTRMAYWILPTLKGFYSKSATSDRSSKMSLSLMPTYSSKMAGLYLAASF